MTQLSYEDAEVPVGDNLLRQISDTADYQRRLEAEIEEMELELKKKREEHRRVSQNVLPELMDNASQRKLETTDGIEINVSEKVRAHIPKDRKTEAHKYLEDNGHGSLIKRQFVIDFDRDEEAWARKFEADLKKRKKQLRVARTDQVHPQTLEKFVRTALDEGRDIPLDLFGVHRQRFTKVKLKDD